MTKSLLLALPVVVSLISVPSAAQEQKAKTEVYVKNFEGDISAKMGEVIAAEVAAVLVNSDEVVAFTFRNLSDQLKEEEHKELLKCEADSRCIDELISSFGFARRIFGHVSRLEANEWYIDVTYYDRDRKIGQKTGRFTGLEKDLPGPSGRLALEVLGLAGAKTSRAQGGGKRPASGDQPSSPADGPTIGERDATDEDGGGGVVEKRPSSGGSPSDFSAVGAVPVSAGHPVLSVAVGFPEVQMLYHRPLGTDFEIAGGAGLFYGYNPTTAGDVSGFMGLMELRWRFWNSDRHSMAMTAAPAVYFEGDPDFAVGLVVGGPGVVYDYEIKGKHHAVLGASVPWGLFFFDDGTVARIPLLFKTGMEFAIADGLHIFATSETGADLWTGDNTRDALLFVRVLGGAAFAL